MDTIRAQVDGEEITISPLAIDYVTRNSQQDAVIHFRSGEILAVDDRYSSIITQFNKRMADITWITVEQ